MTTAPAIPTAPPAESSLAKHHLRARAPLRISFAGGGTDVAPFPELEGGCVLSATIARYAYGSLSPRTDGRIRVQSVDLGIEIDFDCRFPGAVDGSIDLAKAAILRLSGNETAGFDLLLHSDAPPGSGLGSSSTLMVTLIALLMEHHRLFLDEYECAQLAHDVERVDLGIAGGMQDQYAAAFGGFNLIEFHGNEVVVNALRVRDSVVDELEHNLLLCFTGRTRASNHIIDDQTQRLVSSNEDTLRALREQKALAFAMKDALLHGKLDEFGEFMHTAWQAKRQMSPMIATPQIEEIYDVARRAGALGGKVTGAGGGGYILLYCPFSKRHRVIDALTRVGASCSNVAFEPRGVTTWRTLSKD